MMTLMVLFKISVTKIVHFHNWFFSVLFSISISLCNLVSQSLLLKLQRLGSSEMRDGVITRKVATF